MPNTQNDSDFIQKLKTELEKLKAEYLENLDKLLQNPEKKETKVVKAEAEEMFKKYSLSVSNLKKLKVKELEAELNSKEEKKLEELYQKLMQIE